MYSSLTKNQIMCLFVITCAENAVKNKLCNHFIHLINQSDRKQLNCNILYSLYGKGPVPIR